MARALAALMLLLALFGCSPQYEIRYRLELPPDAGSAAARQCLAACTAASDACTGEAQAALGACEDRATLRQAACQSRADMDFQVCQASARDTGKMCVRRFCRRERCPRVSFERCDADYRACFRSCGGTVVEERRCVANCPS
jgi:hypothetical protein